VNCRERKMAERKAQLVRQGCPERFDYGMCHSAEGALVVPILDQGHGCIDGTPDVIPRGRHRLCERRMPTGEGDGRASSSSIARSASVAHAEWPRSTYSRS
jgi:hypothetical protein